LFIGKNYGIHGKIVIYIQNKSKQKRQGRILLNKKGDPLRGEETEMSGHAFSF
jgi:hypothetical protein